MINKQKKDSITAELTARRLPFRVIAAKYGCSISFLTRLSQKLGITKKYIPEVKRIYPRKDKQRDTVWRLHMEGYTTAAIGRQCKISRQRVDQLISKVAAEKDSHGDIQHNTAS